MKVSSKRTVTMADFNLKFYPKTLLFSRQPLNLIKVYLEKNVQVLGQVEEIVDTHQVTLKFQFNQDPKPIEFRAISPKNCDYQISLYQILDDQTEKFLVSSSVNFSSFLKEYEDSFIKQDEKLQVDMRDVVNKGLPELWRGLRQNISKKSLEGTIKFSSIKAVLQYNLVPFHEYDEMVRLDDEDQERKKEKMAKANFHRTSTLPTIPKNTKIMNKGGNDASTILIVPKSNYQSQKLERSKTAVKQNFAKFSQRFQGKGLMNIPEKVEGNFVSKSEVDGEPQRSGVAGKLQIEAFELDDRLEDQQLREVGILPTREKAEELETVQQQGNKTKESLTVDRHRSLVSPENTLGIVSIKSNETSKGAEFVTTEGSSRLKEYLLMFFLTVVGGFLTVFLMHPISKTD